MRISKCVCWCSVAVMHCGVAWIRPGRTLKPQRVWHVNCLRTPPGFAEISYWTGNGTRNYWRYDQDGLWNLNGYEPLCDCAVFVLRLCLTSCNMIIVLDGSALDAQHNELYLPLVRVHTAVWYSVLRTELMAQIYLLALKYDAWSAILRNCNWVWLDCTHE